MPVDSIGSGAKTTIFPFSGGGGPTTCQLYGIQNNSTASVNLFINSETTSSYTMGPNVGPVPFKRSVNSAWNINKIEAQTTAGTASLDHGILVV